MPQDSFETERTTVLELLADFFERYDVNALDDHAVRIARFKAGLAVVAFDLGHGGLGVSSSLQKEVDTAFLEAGSPDWTARNVIGLGMAAPTIHAHGTEAQKETFLEPLFTGEHIWCQLFSEPGAGSDLASLSTRAVRTDDGYIVNGQKVWTSLGHVARWGLLLARTDPSVPKHRGLTYFLVDMQAQGMQVRPLRQLTGEAEFNEVYLDNVIIPDTHRLGDEGSGWKIALTTLSNERASLGGSQSHRGGGPIAQAVQAFRDAAEAGTANEVSRDRLMRLWTRAEAARLTNVRSVHASHGGPGAEGSIAKLQMAEVNQAVYEFCVDINGETSLSIDTYVESQPDFAAVHGGNLVTKAYLRSLANSIEGGTSEIQRNILGERVLGLPPENRIDKDIPWSSTAR